MPVDIVLPTTLGLPDSYLKPRYTDDVSTTVEAKTAQKE